MSSIHALLLLLPCYSYFSGNSLGGTASYTRSNSLLRTNTISTADCPSHEEEAISRGLAATGNFIISLSQISYIWEKSD